VTAAALEAVVKISSGKDPVRARQIKKLRRVRGGAWAGGLGQAALESP
jgi:hypothetical protein